MLFLKNIFFTHEYKYFINRSIDSGMGRLQFLQFRGRLDLEVMAMKRYPALSKSPPSDVVNCHIVFYEARYLDLAQGRMNGAHNVKCHIPDTAFLAGGGS